MNDRSQSRLASVLMLGIGAWLMASPLFISVSGAAFTNVLIVGAIIALAGLAQLIWTSTLPSWITAITAVWLLVSAFIFSADTGFVWSVALSAVAAFILAVWDGIEVNHLQHSGHQAAV
jgi:hypothetical protein